MQGRECPHNRPPVKNSGPESQMSFPGRQHLTCAVVNWGALSMSCVTLWEMPLGSLLLIFWDFTPCAFCLCISFHYNIINHSHEYEYMLSPIGPPSKSLSLEVVWRTYLQNEIWVLNTYFSVGCCEDSLSECLAST